MRGSKKIITMLLSTLLITIVGCGENNELTTYQEEMMLFTENILTLDNNINAIDSEASDAVEKLLGYLDSMDSEFIKLAEMPVPDQFISIESLADESSEYMTASVTGYHGIFSSTNEDEYELSLATESYKRAMTRIHYISDILQGNLPEGDDVTISYTDENGDAIPDSTDVDSTDVESTDVESTDVESTDVESTDVEPTEVESSEVE